MMMKSIKLSLMMISLAISTISGANILYLSAVPSPSHFIWCKSILTALLERGHNITALSGDVEKSKANLTFLHLDQMYPAIYNGSKEIDFLEYNELSPLGVFMLYAGLSEKACQGAVLSKGYRQLLDYPDTFKFDVVIHDFTMGPCVLGFVDKFRNPPIVGVSPFNELARLSRISGSLIYPAFVPGHDLLYSQRMSFLERLNNLITHQMGIAAFKYFIVPKADKIVRKYHPSAPYLEDIERRTSIFLINNNPLFDYKEPYYTNVRLVGGAQIRLPKSLPADLKEFVDSASNGIVYFSLGTNVRSDKLGAERIAKILKAFKHLSKYKFLWKFETKEMLTSLPSNVKIQAWMPQNDILAHPKTKLFISHCGLLGLQEATWHGVPILGFPVFGDQPQNSHRYVELGVSEQLSILNFTEHELVDLIEKMMESQTYREKMKTISSAFKDRVQTPLEESIYWIEWISRHPQIDFQGPAKDLNFFIRHSFDVLTVVIIILLSVLYLKMKFIAFVIRTFLRPTKNKLGDKKKQKIN